MISAIISRIVILLFGTLYPAYASYKAVRTKNVKEYVKWMMYWIVFALFTCAETFTDLFISFWFPFYYEIKIVLVIWLLSPATKGSSILYRNFVHPALIKREPEIEEYISKAKEQGYHTMLQLGSKGVTYATNVIVQTAMKGGGGIVNQIRRSYSLSDLSTDSDAKADLNRNSKAHGDTVDSAQVPRDPRLRAQRKQFGNHADLQRKQVGNHADLQRKLLGGNPDLYFPEMDVDFRTMLHEIPISLSNEIRSTEDVSSGYCSGDTLYAEGLPPPEGNPLMRTASVGGVRARATRPTRNTTSQPKKPLVAEEEEEEGLTDFYGWPQAFPYPVTSMYSEILSPLGLPPQALLNPEVMEMMLNNSFFNNELSSANIYEVREEQKDSNNLEETARISELLQQKVLGNPMKTSESAQDVSLNTARNDYLSEDGAQEKCSTNMSESKTEIPTHSGNGVSEVLDTDLHKSSQQNENLKTTEIVISSTTNNTDYIKENENKRISESFEDATDIVISANEFLNKQNDSSEDNVTSSAGRHISEKLLEGTEMENKRVSECFEDAIDVEISATKVMDNQQDSSSKDLTTSRTGISEQLLEGTEKENKRVSECFEDATDVEILSHNMLDKMDLISPKDNETKQTQSEVSKRTNSSVSLASSNDQGFEDSLPDLTDASRSGSLSMNDRKGKYKKKHAPPPPDVRRSAEPELLSNAPINNERKDEETEPDLLIRSDSLPKKSSTPEYSIGNTKSDTDYYDDALQTEKMNVTPQYVEKLNIPPTYNMRETSPSPSLKSKKDQSNFSRFLPKASMSSLFNLWGSKESSTKSKTSHSSSGTSYVPTAPSNLDSNIQYVPDISGSSKKDDNLSKSTPKLKLRQMSHSPTRWKHHEYD